MTETSPLAALGHPAGSSPRGPRRHVLQDQGRPGRGRGRGARRRRGRDGCYPTTGSQSASSRSAARGSPARTTRTKTPGSSTTAGSVPATSAVSTSGLHDHLGPDQGRDQVRRRVDLLGGAGECGDGAPRRVRGRRDRHARTRSGRNARSSPSYPSPAAVPHPRTWSTSCQPGAKLVAARPVDVHRRGAQDQRRQVRQEGHAGRLCGRRLRGAEARHCPSERAERGHGAHGRAARGPARGAG